MTKQVFIYVCNVCVMYVMIEQNTGISFNPSAIKENLRKPSRCDFAVSSSVFLFLLSSSKAFAISKHAARQAGLHVNSP